jgi:dihydropteroate synthase
MTRLMAVLNITPDSFSDGGLYLSPHSALTRARQLLSEGADILDIGGESTRPGASPVSAEEELRRVLPVVEALASESAVPLSIDTAKPEVAETCLRAGARIVNDVTGLTNPEMLRVAARHHASVVIMHMRGTPQTMRSLTGYDDLIADISSFLGAQARLARDHGIDDIILDPGIGFAKTAAQSFLILRRLPEFAALGYPVLIGASRKSFLGTLSSSADPEQRLEASVAAAVVAAMNGASIVRVHDVRETRKALEVVNAVHGAANQPQ